MKELKEKIKELQKENRWIEIVHILDPQLLENSPQWGDIFFIRAAGFAHSQLRHLPEAERYYGRWMELEPKSAAAQYSMGYLFYLQKDFAKALDWYDKALALFPDYLICLYRKGVILVAQEKARQALEVLKHARGIFESSKSGDFRRRNFKTYVKLLFQLGKAYSQLHLYKKAIGVFQELVNLDKRRYVANLFKFYNLGKNYLELGQFEKAVSYLKQALRENDKAEFVWERLGRVYHAREDYGEALKHFARALDCRRAPYIFVSRAQTYLAMGEIEKAKRDFHTALKRDQKSRHKIYLVVPEKVGF